MHLGRSRLGPRQPDAGRGKAAFTLTELCVAMAVIALLVAVMVPMVQPAFETAYKTRCLNHLSKIVQALHASHDESTTLPGQSTWVADARSHGSKEMLRCDKDTTLKPSATAGAFAELYILQYNTTSQTSFVVTYLVDILAPGKPLNDPQIWAWYPAIGKRDTPKGESWPASFLPNLAANQAFIGIDNDSALKITFGAQTTFEVCEPPSRGHSRHWLIQGKGTPPCPLGDNVVPTDSDDKELLHMWGRDMLRDDPRSPLRFGSTEAVSYGMNGMIDPANYGPKQFLVMDANEPVLQVGTTNYEDAEVFSSGPQGVIKARHFGKVNVATCDGSVTSWTLPELRAQFDQVGNGRWGSH
jgi:type II secretory pathway pseudopilin PulG